MSQNPHPSPYKAPAACAASSTHCAIRCRAAGRDRTRPPSARNWRWPCCSSRRILPGPHHGRGLLPDRHRDPGAGGGAGQLRHRGADALSVETHPLLGRAKDLGSAAVMLLRCCRRGWASRAASSCIEGGASKRRRFPSRCGPERPQAPRPQGAPLDRQLARAALLAAGAAGCIDCALVAKVVGRQYSRLCLYWRFVIGWEP